MYLGFYGLKEKPFNPTPDPRFLYLTVGHREALAQLEYGVQERCGFLMLTGEVGTGKTTLLQELLRRLDKTKTEVAYVFNSKLPFEGILEYVLEDLGITNYGTSEAQRLFTLNQFLIERRRADLDTVVIIDEAQNLDVSALEQIRLLSNFETPTDKLMQILLVGQPELREKLLLPELRQLRQRISLRCRIQPMTLEDTRAYVRHRIDIARSPFRQSHSPNGTGPFADPAIVKIWEYSQGIPRVVNVVCDHCLLIGYADKKPRIDRDIVEEAIDYLEERERPPAKPAAEAALRETGGWSRRVGIGGLVAVTLLAVIFYANRPELLGHAWNSIVDYCSNLAHRAANLLN